MNALLTRARIVESARGWVGTPYRHQASLRAIGCDCLGLVRGVWREVLGPEPEEPGPYAPDWAEASGLERLADAGARHFTPVVVADFNAGDVLLFRWREGLPAKHAAIATSREKPGPGPSMTARASISKAAAPAAASSISA